MRAEKATAAGAVDVLDSFCAAFAARDAESVFRLFAPDDDVAMVTSEQALLRGPDEIRAFLERYARGETTYSWTWERRDVSASGSVAWVLAEGTETAAAPARREAHPYRMTLVCEQRGDRWLLLQIHGSSPH